jgi:hypothetical protein
MIVKFFLNNLNVKYKHLAKRYRNCLMYAVVAVHIPALSE